MSTGAGRRNRLSAVPLTVIRLATRRVPACVRSDLREEWIAELIAIVHGPSDSDLSRLLCGVRFSFGLLCAASRISRDLDPAGKASKVSGRLAPGIPYAHLEAERARWVYLNSGVSTPRPLRRPSPGI
jgi:hypothetical protein